MKTYTFINRSLTSLVAAIVEITARSPAEAVRQLVAKHGVGPWSILGIY